MVCWRSNVVTSAATKNELDEKELVWLLGGGCGEGGRVVGEKLICLQLLSLIACACLTGSITVNHCGSTRLLRHTILLPSSPQTNDLIHKRCMIGELPEGSVLKPSDQEGV